MLRKFHVAISQKIRHIGAMAGQPATTAGTSEVENFGAHAPISEAIIDIYTTLPAATTTDVLRGLHGNIRDKYPNERARRRWESTISLEGAGASRSETFGIDGWLFTSSDGRQVVQFRLDGFTVNRLPPYDRWETLREECRRLWSVFQEGAKPDTIQRIAVRYLNRFKLRVGEDLDQFFTAGPRVPAALPQTLQGFLVQVVVPDPRISASATITQALESSADPEHISIVLDIEVSRGQLMSSRSEGLWESLESLRDFKNRVFFASITDRMKHRIRSGEAS